MLSEKFSITISANFKTGVPLLEASINNNVKAEYDTKYEFVGPLENSKYNSREFRVQFYAKDVDWVQYYYNNGKTWGRCTGTALVPTKYLLYSIDHVVS